MVHCNDVGGGKGRGRDRGGGNAVKDGSYMLGKREGKEGTMTH